MKKAIKKIYWLLCVQFGLDFLRLARSLRGLPRYVRELYRFMKGYKGRLDFFSCLHDWYEEGGATKNEYFFAGFVCGAEGMRALGWGVRTFDPSKPDGTPRKLLDVSRLTALGWRARIGLEEGLLEA
jgi:hypothetical protein